MNVRAFAAQCVAHVVHHRQSCAALLHRFKEQCTDARDQRLLQELTYGSLRWYPRLRGWVDHCVTRPFKAKDQVVGDLLCVGLYQLLFLRGRPHSVVNETVAAAQLLGKPWAKGLVNAVLRRFCREREVFMTLVERDEVLRHAHPRWWITRLGHCYGSGAPAILSANNERPPMVLRVNRRRLCRDQYLDHLHRAEIGARPFELTEEGVVLDQPVEVQCLPGFSAGWVSVQDGAAQLAAGLLAPEPGMRVLDACAAPGGKTAHILERCPDCRLVAVDRGAGRAEKIRQTLARLALTARVEVGDATAPDFALRQARFERILLDAPCSASGIVRRQPEIKYLRDDAAVAAAGKMQAALLEALWPLLEPGGILLYATCSVFPEENSGVVGAFVNRTADARVSSIDVPWGHSDGIGRQILPGEGGMDGFYYARLMKRSE